MQSVCIRGLIPAMKGDYNDDKLRIQVKYNTKLKKYYKGFCWYMGNTDTALSMQRNRHRRC